MSPAKTGQENAMALQAVIQAALLLPQGAIILIPAFDDDSPPNLGVYKIDFSGLSIDTITVGSSASPIPLLICGTGSTKLEMHTEGATLFDVQNGNTIFQDLSIDWHSETHGLGTAFLFSSPPSYTAENCGLFRVNVDDCQYPVIFNGVNNSSALECYISYHSDYGVPIAAVTIEGGSSGTVIDQCVLQYFMPEMEKPPSSVLYGMYIDESSGTTVRSTQISDFDTGVIIQPSASPSGPATDIAFTGVEISGYGPSLVINPPVFNASFTECRFQCGNTYEVYPISAMPGVIIGSPGDVDSQIDTIRFTSCNLIGNVSTYLYGMQIAAGQNIQINGGRYGGNATAGISIAGGREIQIFGANCTGYEFRPGEGFGPTYQLYGIYITGGQDIQIVGVNCSACGLPGSPATPGTGIYVDGYGSSVSDVRIVGAVCANPPFSSEESVTQQYGIQVQYASNILIKDCFLTEAEEDETDTGFGLYLEGCDNVTVAGCGLYGNAAGAIYIGSGCDNVFVRKCNATGYGSAFGDAIAVYGSPTNVQVTDCAGYNDLASKLTTTVPVGSFSGISQNYYGPVAFYVYEGGGILMGTYATGLGSGSFTLDAGGTQTAQITTVIPLTKFLMVGN
jgi:hypothetical protein